jgi:fido (protein-threonine AMPylation protein)
LLDANHIHPFPEGNGRSLQVFMKELARTQEFDERTGFRRARGRRAPSTSMLA